MRLPRALTRRNALDRQVVAAYREALRRFSGRPDVTGISIGIKERSRHLLAAVGPVIVFHVRRKSPDVPRRRRLPAAIHGVPTDVVRGDFTLTACADPLPQPPAFPLRPGASLAVSTGSAATIGAVVRDRQGARHLLTAAHVVRENGATKGARMVHPGPLDLLSSLVAVATVSQWNLGVDAGMARLTDGLQASNRVGSPPRRILPPHDTAAGDVLEKVGRTTGRTQGVVRCVGCYLAGRVGPVAYLKPLPGDPAPISLCGDSGAMWYDEKSHHAKALHHGVDLRTREAVAVLMPRVMSKLAVLWE